MNNTNKMLKLSKTSSNILSQTATLFCKFPIKLNFKIHLIIFLFLYPILISSCSLGDNKSGVHSTDYLGEPLVSIKGKLNTSFIVNENSELKASIIWMTYPDMLIECLNETYILERDICFENSQLIPNAITKSIDIEPIFPSSFEIPIYDLPKPNDLSGSTFALMGTGVLVVYTDGNNNNELDLVSPEATESADTIIGASYHSENLDLIIYREGDLASAWSLFDFFDCPDPEQGFSVVSLLNPNDDQTDFSCELSSAESTEISIVFEDSDIMKQNICEPRAIKSTYPNDPYPEGNEIKCYGKLSFKYRDPLFYCNNINEYKLVDCYFLDYWDTACSDPEWDLRDSVPEWWPCDGTINDGFELINSPDVITEEADNLFSIHYNYGKHGDERDNIEKYIIYFKKDSFMPEFDSNDMIVRLEDNDRNELFSPGDILHISEKPGFEIIDANTEVQEFVVEIIEITKQLGGSIEGTGLTELLWIL